MREKGGVAVMTMTMVMMMMISHGFVSLISWGGGGESGGRAKARVSTFFCESRVFTDFVDGRG